MTQRDNILQELRELESSLEINGSQNVYRVPSGYFDNLAELVLSRIRAMETQDAGEELANLSPFLSRIPKVNPYAVPADFFDGIAITAVTLEDKSADEELKELSPLLSGLKKEVPYTVPTNYFESLTKTNVAEIRPVGKVVSISRPRWIRYAAAAVLIGIVATVGFRLFNGGNGKIDPKTQSAQWVKEKTKKISTDEISKFVQVTDESARDIANVDVTSIKEEKDVQELIKDIPEKDIQNFLSETEPEVTTNDEEVLMN